MSAELHNMAYQLMLTFGISTLAGMAIIAFGVRLWEMRAAELKYKKLMKGRRNRD